MEFHAIRELRTLVAGNGPAARQAFQRLLWFERGRQDIMVHGRALRVTLAKNAGTLAHAAYMDGYLNPRPVLGTHKCRTPRPLRAGSAEVRS